jgi:hypothetical protein
VFCTEYDLGLELIPYRGFLAVFRPSVPVTYKSVFVLFLDYLKKWRKLKRIFPAVKCKCRYSILLFPTYNNFYFFSKVLLFGLIFIVTYTRLVLIVVPFSISFSRFLMFMTWPEE